MTTKSQNDLASKLANKFTIELEEAGIQMVPRNCRLSSYKPFEQIGESSYSTELVCFASPDSSYAVIRDALQTAKSEVFISIYDFTAGYMEDLLKNLTRRGVKLKLMIDYDRRAGEADLIDRISKLKRTKVVIAPSCGNTDVKLFPSCHEKVIVIDKATVLVESCNWTENSVPKNALEPNEDGSAIEDFATGNREWGVWVKSDKVATSFYDVLMQDFAKGMAYGEYIGIQDISEDLYEAIVVRPPPKMFRRGTFRVSGILAVLTPDNYFQSVKALISEAKHSIFIQQQYVKPKSSHVSQLLDLMGSMKEQNGNLDIRIMVSPKVFSAKQRNQLEADMEDIEDRFGLRLGDNIRYLNLNYFVHCHNKGILIDDEITVVASQNWSQTGIGEKGANREAGVVIHDKNVNRYFSNIFKSDWDLGTKRISVTRVIREGDIPATIQTLGPRIQFAKINPGDYIEV
jgi:phosphatidylserine/phosphatidylglycerophosphate/cardiolipin synthase-like enzyme